MIAIAYVCIIETALKDLKNMHWSTYIRPCPLSFRKGHYFLEVAKLLL